jgi:hypothetical protein
MLDTSALETALAAWQQSGNEDDKIKVQQKFERLPLGHQNIILDAATVGRGYGYDVLERILQSWHGDEAATWIIELQLCRVMGPVQTRYGDDGYLFHIHPELADVAQSVLRDPQSCHYGSRVWVEYGRVRDGEVCGWQQVSAFYVFFQASSCVMVLKFICMHTHADACFCWRA